MLFRSKDGENKPKRHRGRPNAKPFAECFQNPAYADVVKAELQNAVGRKAALIVEAAMSLGWCDKPAFSAIKKVANVGKTFQDYFCKDQFSENELNGWKENLKSKIR